MVGFWEYYATYFRGCYASFRRRILYFFNRKHVEESIAKRKGECECGGVCCYRFASFCRHLDNGKCKVYYKQPLFCRLFPIDEKDLELTGLKDECTYYWGARK